MHSGIVCGDREPEPYLMVKPSAKRSNLALSHLGCPSLINSIVELTGFKYPPYSSEEISSLNILGRMYPLNWDYWASVQGPLLDTIKMSILGSVIGYFHGIQPLWLLPTTWLQL